MPGVQKPHWLAPWATKADAQTSRAAGLSPSSVVTCRPATRRTGVTHDDARSTVDPDGAAPALALGAAAVLHGPAPELLAQRIEKRDPVGDRDGIAVEDEVDVAGSHRRTGLAARSPGVATNLEKVKRGRPRAALPSGGRDAAMAGAQLNEEPQPQVRVALGLMMWKPAPCKPSL